MRTWAQHNVKKVVNIGHVELQPRCKRGHKVLVRTHGRHHSMNHLGMERTVLG